jgi:hypothetical protein
MELQCLHLDAAFWDALRTARPPLRKLRFDVVALCMLEWYILPCCALCVVLHPGSCVLFCLRTNSNISPSISMWGEQEAYMAALPSLNACLDVIHTLEDVRLGYGLPPAALRCEFVILSLCV